MKPEIPKTLTILITHAVREKRIKGLICHFFFKILLMLSKQHVTPGFRTSPYRSHRASAWVNVCTSLILNTYEPLVQQSGSSQSAWVSSCPRVRTYFNCYRATVERQISKTCGNLEHEYDASHCFWDKLPNENAFLPVIYRWTRPYFIYFEKYSTVPTLTLYRKGLCCDGAPAGIK